MQDRAGAPISRRRFGGLSLAAASTLAGLAACGSDDPQRPVGTQQAGPEKVAYGSDPSQFGEYTAPTGTGAARGLVVVIHGGFWRSGFGLELCRPLAAALVEAGWATWNIEYRRVGNGGGWTATFDDAAQAVDHVRTFASARLPADRIYAIGHSAGGHLAAWLAGRPTLPPGAPGANPRVTLAGAVSQAGVLDLAAALRRGDEAVADLVGGTPRSSPERYRIASPIEQVPIRVPVLCVHGTGDDVVPIAQSESYVRKARAAGDRADLVRVEGANHTDVIDVGTPAGKASVAALDRISA